MIKIKTCPCCGYKTLENKSIYDICEICFWEDDPVQLNNPDYVGGANVTSLRQAQLNYIAFGACDIDCIDMVRKPTTQDIRAKGWRTVRE